MLVKKVTNQISLQSCNDSNLYNKSAGDTQEGRKETNATLINLLFSLLTLHLQKMEVHSCVGCRDREQRDPVVVSERLYGLVGIEIEVVIVLVAFLDHVGLLDGGRMNAQRAMKGTCRRVSATGVSML